jgi:hypothetical protein
MSARDRQPRIIPRQIGEDWLISRYSSGVAEQLGEKALEQFERIIRVSSRHTICFEKSTGMWE